MIKKITKGTEIAISVLNEVGVLAKVTSFLVNHGVNIQAISGIATPVGEAAELVFVTDNNYTAIEALDEHGYKISENGILIVELENNPGALKNISEILAQSEININYLYATTCSKGCPTKIILSTSDNAHAIDALKSR
ncbi:MAG: ACT domain-containing protein [Candidatus Omnitrophota bacterium]